MKNYIVNFDFELQLENSKLGPNSKINNEFEYVFFFINKEKCTLNNYYSYNKQYEKYLNHNNIEFPKLLKSDSTLWWGNPFLTNSINLNSKVFSSRLALKDNVLPNSFSIVSDSSEVKKKLKGNIDYLLRSDFGFSGKGHLKINNSSDINKIENFLKRNGKCILSPYLNRVLDIGITINLNDGSYFITENFNHPSGSFRGGRYYASIEKLKEQYPFINEEKLDKSILWNKNTALSNGAVDTIEVDMFYYKDKETTLLCSHVEWNYRKTMGLMLKSLQDYFGEEFVSWIIIPFKSINKKVDSNIYSSFLEKVLITSPLEGHYFFSFAVGASSIEDHNHLISNTLDQLSITDEFTRKSYFIKS